METMTVEQVLEITVKIFSEISVPVEYTEQIGIPIYRGVQNLKECIRAIRQKQENGGEEHVQN